jgi:hypothetical protein
MNRRPTCRAIAVVLALTAAAAAAEDVKTPFPPAKTVDEIQQHRLTVSPPERIGPGQYRIGEIQINKAEKSVSFPAFVNMNKGLLEYVIVRNAGKTHESLLRTAIEPYNLQLACLLVGMEGTSKQLAYQGDPATPQGEPVEILLQIKDKDGNATTIKPESWLTKMVGDNKREVSALDWVYTGSVVGNGRFAAQMSGSIVALYHDPVAMFDNASPGGESDKIWFAREESAPPVGTPVTVIIRSKR